MTDRMLSAKELAVYAAGNGPLDGIEPIAAQDELQRRANDGDPEAQEALAMLEGSEVAPADDPEFEPEQ